MLFSSLSLPWWWENRQFMDNGGLIFSSKSTDWPKSPESFMVHEVLNYKFSHHPFSNLWQLEQKSSFKQLAQKVLAPFVWFQQDHSWMWILSLQANLLATFQRDSKYLCSWTHYLGTDILRALALHWSQMFHSFYLIFFWEKNLQWIIGQRNEIH